MRFKTDLYANVKMIQEADPSPFCVLKSRKGFFMLESNQKSTLFYSTSRLVLDIEDYCGSSYSQEIKNRFSAKKKPGAVFVDLLTANGTAATHAKLLRLVPGRHMINLFIQQ